MSAIPPPPKPSLPISDALGAALDLEISAIAREALERIGRTEDIRFSPSNNRIAIAGYAHASCFILDVVIDRRGDRPVVRINDYVELRSPAGLKAPHGFDFIDEDTLVVANREGLVSLFDISGRQQGERVMTRAPKTVIGRAGLLSAIHSPGSVAVVRTGPDSAELLVCHNYKHRVSRHPLSLKGSAIRPGGGSIVIERGLLVPDGVAVSPDQRWIAVSSHLTRCVMIYDRTLGLDRNREPDGRAFGVSYPHGLRFSPDGKTLYVADAGAPILARFESADGDWAGPRDATALYRVLDDATFEKGRTNIEEGGPKGLDFDGTGTVMAMTCEEQALAFFHVPELAGAAGRPR
ncbi:MAG: YncE family protein [Devosia sp.]